VDKSKKPYFSSMAELLESWRFKDVETFIFLFFYFSVWFVVLQVIVE